LLSTFSPDEPHLVHHLPGCGEAADVADPAPELEIEGAVLLFPLDETGHDNPTALFFAVIHRVQFTLQQRPRPGKGTAALHCTRNGREF
jgi:hypothetical protein